MVLKSDTHTFRHIAEEVPNPGRNVPIAIATQMIIGFFTALLYIIAIVSSSFSVLLQCCLKSWAAPLLTILRCMLSMITMRFSPRRSQSQRSITRQLDQQVARLACFASCCSVLEPAWLVSTLLLAGLCGPLQETERHPFPNTLAKYLHVKECLCTQL